MDKVLEPNDLVGVSFWLISMAMVAATVFFFLERGRVQGKWRTSLTVAGLVTGIAAVHYFYMRDVWVATGASPTVYRYIDWLLTVPLQIVEFYLILAAIAVVPAALFWRLLVASVVMLVGGYLGEIGAIGATPGFVIGMIGWIYIIYEIFVGEASKINANSGNAACQSAFKTLRLIVTIGWAIYPIGYVFGYMMGSIDANSLNAIYNIADFVNKIAFGVAIWLAAVRDSEEQPAIA
ncbi:MAG: bacteriorhodopsin-like [Pseudomonadota bacterium]